MNRILSKYYIKLIISTVSPIIIGSGNEGYADIVFLKDSDGAPFIPGSTIAGVCRNHLLYELGIDEKVVNCIFGQNKSDKDDSTMSMLTFYDVYIKEGKKAIEIRDGVELEKTQKIAKDENKYSFEVVKSGVDFEIRIEGTVRENIGNVNKSIDCIEHMDTVIESIISSFEKAEIRIGAKTRRGYGKVKATKKYSVNYKSNENDFLSKVTSFTWENIDRLDEKKFQKKDSNNNGKPSIINISLPMKITDTFIIRNYRQKDLDIDYATIKELDIESSQHNHSYNTVPVITGTTWAGAFRHHIYKILTEMKVEEKEIEKIINKLFGRIVKKGDKGETKASRIIFEESLIRNCAEEKIVRNKIDRFTGGVVSGALIKSSVIFGGELDLNIKIKGEKGKDVKNYEIGLILLSIYDLLCGIMTVGGETSIGRGIMRDISFEKDKERNISINKKIISTNKLKINGNTLKDDSEYMKALYTKLEVKECVKKS